MTLVRLGKVKIGLKKADLVPAILFVIGHFQSGKSVIFINCRFGLNSNIKIIFFWHKKTTIKFGLRRDKCPP